MKLNVELTTDQKGLRYSTFEMEMFHFILWRFISLFDWSN